MPKPPITTNIPSSEKSLQTVVPIIGEYSTIWNPYLHNLPGHVKTQPITYTAPPTFNIPSTIKEILQSTETTIQPNPWIFKPTIRAATLNSLHLEQMQWDVHRATQTPNGTILSYGSEFRDITHIEALMKYHPDFNLIQNIIVEGAQYPLEKIEENDRLADLNFHLARGNHQSALTSDNNIALKKAFQKELDAQWAIPLSPSCIKLIPGASITPLGVATQWSMNAAGDRVIKRRPTHDCSFPGPSGLSCNKRVINDLVPECRYGHALRRFLHGIADMRRRHHNTPIILTKTDMDAAYRRIHTNMASAITCITVLEDIAYLLTRLPFGSSPAPPLFSVLSDGITDLAWDLALDNDWDSSSLQSRFDFLDHIPSLAPSEVPFGQADPLMVDLPPRDIVADNFIDDIFMAGVDAEDNRMRITHSIPLALECLFKPPSDKDASTRNEIINITKHLAEGLPAEVKTILGWRIDTRTFKVYLSENKWRDWTKDVTAAIKNKYCSKATLESLIGRFNHVGVVIHISRYFLTRLRFRLHHHNATPKFKRINLAPWDVKDLILWKHHLEHLHLSGVSINNICLTKPSSITYSDACEWGMGGFTDQGTAWRLQLPPHLQHRASINLLEFIAAIITIQMTIFHDDHSHTNNIHILAFTDSSSALGWLYHSTFNPVKNHQHDNVARYLSNIILQANATLHPEHVPGRHNEIADVLSRDFHLSDSDTIHLLYHSQDTAQKMPKKFNIMTPNPPLISWVVSVLELLPPTKQTQAQQQPSTTAASFCSKHSYKNATSMTPSWTATTQTNAHSSCQDLHTASGATTTKPHPSPNWQEAQSLPPSPTWFRPSGRTLGPTPPLIAPVQGQLFYPTN